MRKFLMRRALPVVATLTTLAGVGAVMPQAAQAQGAGAVVFEGTATLNSGFPCNGGQIQVSLSPTYGCTGGAFAGTAFGAFTNGTTVANCATGCPMNSGYTYTEACLAAAGTPLAGGAGGNFTIGTQIAGGFAWVRVGLTAIIVLQTSAPGPGVGAAVAVFVPTSPVPPGDCSHVPGPVTTALVVGIGGGVVT